MIRWLLDRIVPPSAVEVVGSVRHLICVEPWQQFLNSRGELVECWMTQVWRRVYKLEGISNSDGKRVVRWTTHLADVIVYPPLAGS